MKKIDHINVTVPNLEKAIEFYTNVLGYKVTHKFKGNDMEFIFVSDGNVTYEIIQGDVSQAKFDHIAYVSEDIKADYNYYKNLDSNLLQGEVNYLDFLFEAGMYYFFIQGPNGESIEFCQKG
ncbi:hypothetical protein AN639_12130 [Candidatus Epulonipiscium fishelsonii]|uniref:Uncharacterized protein n=1 Tax=Candidatus Epulonipiscium fishelsonii TaxID=77094 RepID=A0ACC8X7U7_9FIRM|nr:hypothetical protein AN396_12570 [Epulopiscium sp. SCG-B11WGA-EpuloA1]ONI42675.1 hypothetical protein AN639_12130 [Epulopiscium sp. SCG-B05WGA-EpuloA1]